MSKILLAGAAVIALSSPAFAWQPVVTNRAAFGDPEETVIQAVMYYDAITKITQTFSTNIPTGETLFLPHFAPGTHCVLEFSMIIAGPYAHKYDHQAAPTTYNACNDPHVTVGAVMAYTTFGGPRFSYNYADKP